VFYCTSCEADAVAKDDDPSKLRCPKSCDAEIRCHLVRRMPQLLLELLGIFVLYSHYTVCLQLIGRSKFAMECWTPSDELAPKRNGLTIRTRKRSRDRTSTTALRFAAYGDQ
jgi:hypothetical protein